MVFSWLTHEILSIYGATVCLHLENPRMHGKGEENPHSHQISKVMSYVKL